MVWIEVDARGKRLSFGEPRPYAQAERARGFERVDHVEVVRPGLCEILPGVRAGIGGDEMLRPVGRRPFGIVALERGGVVLPFVAEYRAEFLELRRRRDQAIPIVVRDLVAEVA